MRLDKIMIRALSSLLLLQASWVACNPPHPPSTHLCQCHPIEFNLKLSHSHQYCSHSVVSNLFPNSIVCEISVLFIAFPKDCAHCYFHQGGDEAIKALDRGCDTGMS